MTKREVLDTLDALRGVVDRLPEGADILTANVDQIGSDPMLGHLLLFTPELQEVAAQFEGVAISPCPEQGNEAWAFVAEGVRVYQYE